MATRHFWVPSGDGRTWELLQARKSGHVWELRRPGKFGARTVERVPIEGEDWVEVHPPERTPAPAIGRVAPPARPAAPPRAKAVRVVVRGESAAEAKPRTAPERPPLPKARKERHTKPVPKLSRELLDLLAQEQRDAAAPAGMVKCPLCGVPFAPMKARKVRTHDDPVKGTRCPASGDRLPGPGPAR